MAQAIHCLVSDAVAIFFALTGAYWFREGNTWGKVGKHYLKIIGTMLACVIIVQVFEPYIYDKNWFNLDSLPSLMNIDLASILNGIVSRDAKLFGSVCSVYWYSLDLGVLVLWFPLLKTMTSSDKTVLIYLFIVLVNCFYSDCSLLFDLGNLRILSTVVLPIQPALILLGYFINKHIDYFRIHLGRIKPYIFLGACYIFRFLLQQHLFSVDNELSTFFRYDRFLSFLIVALWMIAVNAAQNESSKENKSNCFTDNIVKTVRKSTFGIYLIHNILVTKMRSTGLLGNMQLLFKTQLGISLGTLLYTLTSTIIVFTVSYCFVYIIKQILNKLIQLFKHSLPICRE